MEQTINKQGNKDIENVADGLRLIYQKYGRTVFAEGKKLYSLLADTMPNKEKELKALKVACIENAFAAYATIQESQFEAETKKTIRYLVDDCMLSEVWAQKIVGWLLEALGHSLTVNTTGTMKQQSGQTNSTSNTHQQGKTSPTYQPKQQGTVKQSTPQNFSKDLEIVAGMLIRYNGTGGKVVIPKNVKAVKDYAFYHKENVTEVIFEEGCTEIGASAFDGCIRLSKVELPLSVKKINARAFRECISLQRIVIPRGVEFVDISVFENCQQLTLYVAANLKSRAGFEYNSKDEEYYLNTALGKEKYLNWGNAIYNEKIKMVDSYYGTSKVAKFNFFGESLGTPYCLELGAHWENNSGLLEIRITDDTKGIWKDWQVDGVWKKFDKDSIKEVRIVRARMLKKGMVEYHINPCGIIKHTFGGGENKAAEKLYAVLKENNVKVTIE